MSHFLISLALCIVPLSDLEKPKHYNKLAVQERRYLQHCSSAAVIISRDTTKSLEEKIRFYIQITGAATNEL